MKKRIISAALIFMLISVLIPFGLAQTDPTPQVTIDGEPVVFADQTPVIIGGRTLVPIRGVFESLGFEVDWDDETWTAILVRDDYTVLIPIGSSVFTANDVEFTLDVPAQLINERTMLPIRLPLESVGYEVDWDEDTWTVMITTPDADRESDNMLGELMQNTIQATITMEDDSVIVVELFPDLAPQTVRNFVYLTRLGFYDGLRFHRIIANFMIQGGCPQGSGMGGPGHHIKGEFEDNGFPNDLSHTRGVLSMARAAPFDSAGSQFFILHDDATFLDGAYAAFGRVTEGLDVLDVLAQTPNSGPNGQVSPDMMPVIRTITIDSDVELEPPDKL